MLARCAALLVLATAPVLAQEVFLSRIGDTWRYFPALSEISSPASAWRTPGFDDRAWLAGRSGFRAGYNLGEATLLPDTPGYVAVYFRKNFTLTKVEQVNWLTLRVDYSDGFVAYLNGQEIARRNLDGLPGTFVGYNRLATNFHAPDQVEEIDVTAFIGALIPGDNTLALQLHNARPGSAGLVLSAELMANFNRAPSVQNLSSNRVQINWKTPVPSDTAVAYGPTPELNWSFWDTNLVMTHVATLTNLGPDIAYSYRASSSAGAAPIWGPMATFRTFKPAGRVSFIAIGDGGWNSLQQYQLADVVRQNRPDFVLSTGDNVYPSFTAALADLRCFSVYQEHMAQTPYFLSLGNHDLLSGVGSYLEALYLPTNSVSTADHLRSGTSPEHYYSFDQGDVHVTVLFVPFISQYKLNIGDPQYLWLTNDLATTRKPWKVVAWHVPMNSSSGHRFDDFNYNGLLDRLEIRDVLLPVLAQYGVQLVLTGHEHGYERFNPTNGVHAITTAGAGGGLYGFSQLDAASALFWPRYNCVRITVEGDTLQAEALDPAGAVFDAMTIQRASPPPVSYQAAWHSPPLLAEGAGDGAGNLIGQTFGFQGSPIPTVTGQFSNLGRVYVNNDATNLYLGLERVMIYANNNIFFFIESSRAKGVSGFGGLGNGLIDPQAQGADGLDFLSNLSFTNFTPSVACILGDQMADGQFRSFARPNLSLNIGQGAFRLDTAFTDVPDVRLQQFQISPQVGGLPHGQNAGVIALSLPLAQLGGLQPGDLIRIGAVVAGEEFDIKSRRRSLDSGFLGRELIGSGLGSVILQGVEVRLAVDPRLAELRLAFNLQTAGKVRLVWPAAQGRQYQLETTDRAGGPFVDLGEIQRTALPGQTNLTYDLDLKSISAPTRFYRVRELP